MTWRWVVRDLIRHRARTSLSLAGIAIATALLLDMVMLSGGIERSFGRLLASTGFQLRATPGGTLPFDTDATIDSIIPLLVSIGSEPGVVGVGAVLGTTALAQDAHGFVPLVVYGVTPEVQGTYRMVSGSDLTRGDSAGVLLGEPSMQRLRIRVGDSVRLLGRLDPRTSAPAVERVVTVRGIASYVYDAEDQPSIAVTLPLAQRLAGPVAVDRASMLVVRLADSVDVAGMTTRLRARHPAVSWNSVADMMAQFRLRLAYFRQMSLILGAIALVVTILLVGTLLAISVNERIGDIAALRAIGVARASILRQVLLQGLLLTVAGGVAGVGLGLLTARWLDAILTSFPGLPAAISFFVADAHQLAVAAITLLATGLLAGVLPAWRAATTPIAPTLRTDAP